MSKINEMKAQQIVASLTELDDEVMAEIHTSVASLDSAQKIALLVQVGTLLGLVSHHVRFHR